MKFILAIVSTASLAAVDPTPAQYTLGTDLIWTGFSAGSTDFATPTNKATKTTFLSATGTSNSLPAGNFSCVRAGMIEVQSETLNFDMNDGSGSATSSLVVKSGAADVVYWQTASASGFGNIPNLVDGSSGGDNLVSAAGDIPVDIDTSGPFTWGNTDAGTSDDFTLYECCVPDVDVAAAANVVLCPTAVYYQTTDGAVTDGTFSEVPNRKYSVHDSSVDIENGGVAIGSGITRDTDFYLASQAQAMTDGTAANNYCTDQKSSNAFVHDVSSAASTLTVGFLDTSTVTDHAAKCTWQIMASGAKAPSIKVDKFPSADYMVQWIEWAVSTESPFDTAKLLGGATPSSGSLYDFKPEEGDTATFAEIDKLFKYAPGAANFNYKLELFIAESVTGDATKALISDTAADQPIYDIQSAVIFNWIGDVKALDTEYKKQLSAYNGDADSFNSDQETRQTEIEEGKPEEEMTELPERPCPPSVPAYPSSRYVITNNGEQPANYETTDEIVIHADLDMTTDITPTYQLGGIATFQTSGQSSYDFDTVWARKTFGRLGQGEEEFSALRLYVPDTAETNWEQWMMVSVFPNAQDAQLDQDANAEIIASAVDIEALPDTWPSVSKGSVTELDSGASNLIMSSVALAATIAALY